MTMEDIAAEIAKVSAIREYMVVREISRTAVRICGMHSGTEGFKSESNYRVWIATEKKSASSTQPAIADAIKVVFKELGIRRPAALCRAGEADT